MHKTRRLVILDDDPTGIQTTHGSLALTRWTPEAVTRALQDKVCFFFILTNTRALPADQAAERIRSAVKTVEAEARALGIEVLYLLRSDSTLRGHFPLEIETLAETSGIAPDLRLFIPAFFEAGRVTEGDVHYLIQESEKLPCHKSEFARDSVFPYSTAHLPDYIVEKYAGRTTPKVVSIGRELLVDSGDEAIVHRIVETPKGAYLVVNATSYEELDRFSSCLTTYLDDNPTKRVLMQSSSSFVKSITATKESPLITGAVAGTGPGLIIVGSHVEKTPRQLKTLLEGAPDLAPYEIDLSELLADPEDYRSRILKDIGAAAASGKSPVVYTPRKEVSFTDPAARLEAGIQISRFLSRLVVEADFRPSFLVSKGGITSHDILETGLEVDAARVLGQAAPGVPAVRMPDRHRWAGMPYIIFPGNVGSDSTLLEVYRRLRT